MTLKFVRDEVSEKLDYTPGTFTVERHVRPILACPQCETITQAPMPAYVIDKGLATPGLMAHVLVAKYADHLPLYRQEGIFARAGLKIARSILAEWVGACGFALQPLVAALRDEILAHRVLHADETPVKLLKPGSRAQPLRVFWRCWPVLWITSSPGCCRPNRSQPSSGDQRCLRPCHSSRVC